MSQLEENLALHIRALGLPAPDREYRFAREIVGHGLGVKKRLKAAELKDWRFDFAWPGLKFACEVEGGQWTGGRHTTGVGFDGDLDKYDVAARLGWFVYRCNGRMVREGRAVETIEIMIQMIRGER
ncbi:MAG: hypothetical protein GKR96_11460 [Gammaproteobacteria bacterium]|nr:hypothetical protein [Gammaproteobacteria bacterium]